MQIPVVQLYKWWTTGPLQSVGKNKLNRRPETVFVYSIFQVRQADCVSHFLFLRLPIISVSLSLSSLSTVMATVVCCAVWIGSGWRGDLVSEFNDGDVNETHIASSGDRTRKQWMDGWLVGWMMMMMTHTTALSD